MIINNGVLVASDTAENLAKRMSGGNQYLLRLAASEAGAQTALRAVSGVSAVASRGVVEADSVDVVVDFDDGSDPRRAIFAALSKAEMPILQMKPIDVSLEQIFLQLTTDDATNGATG
jgi:ABC-2 type transport system ATP-binding protein